MGGNLNAIGPSVSIQFVKKSLLFEQKYAHTNNPWEKFLYLSTHLYLLFLRTTKVFPI